VDEVRLIANPRVPLRRRVELLLEHPLVDRADRELGTPEDPGFDPARVVERVVGHDAARATADLLGPVGPLVEIVALAPFPGAVRVIDRHPDHGDGGVHTGERPHAWDAPPGPDDHAAVDLLAQDRVWAAHVARPLRRNRGRLDPKPELAQRRRRVEHALVAGAPTLVEREVEIA